MKRTIIQRCPCCLKIKITVQERRMNTKYIDTKMNLLLSCDKCFEFYEQEWADRWKEYYGERL